MCTSQSSRNSNPMLLYNENDGSCDRTRKNIYTTNYCNEPSIIETSVCEASHRPTIEVNKPHHMRNKELSCDNVVPQPNVETVILRITASKPENKPTSSNPSEATTDVQSYQLPSPETCFGGNVQQLTSSGVDRTQYYLPVNKSVTQQRQINYSGPVLKPTPNKPYLILYPYKTSPLSTGSYVKSPQSMNIYPPNPKLLYKPIQYQKPFVNNVFNNVKVGQPVSKQMSEEANNSKSSDC